MSLCLNMIVKNESTIIQTTLENLCQYFPITTFVICDTGSTDNTVECIMQFFAQRGISGEIYQDQWQNFAHNRNLALKRCEGKADYILIFDADDYVEGEFVLPEKLSATAYMLQFRALEADGVVLQRKVLLKNDGKHQWQGVVHEFLSYQGEEYVELIEGNYAVVACSRGFRSQDMVLRAKNDIALLEQAYPTANALAPRYAFYLGQSYYYLGDLEQAIYWYQQRLAYFEKGIGWHQEAYYASYQLALIYHRQQNEQAMFGALHHCLIIDPERAETWYQFARYYNKKKQYALAYDFAQIAHQHPLPNTSKAFLHTEIYHYFIDFEWCQAAYYLGKHEEAFQIFTRLVANAPAGVLVALTPLLQQTFIPKMVSEKSPLLDRLCEKGVLEKH